MLRVTMTQHAVGQGGLASGRIEVDGPPLRWVYDCGSNQPRPLHREIRRVARGGELRHLFLSHLDSDHVIGVDRLLSSCDVHEVVLPYLEEETLLMTLARDASEGRLNGMMVDAAADLAGWFAERGVRVVTFVRGNDEPGGDDRPIGPVDPSFEGTPEGAVESKWNGTVRRTGERTSVRSDASGQQLTTMVQIAEPDALLAMIAGPASLNWVLIPFVHPIPAAKRDAFKKALEKEFGTPLNIADVLKEARTEHGRNKLRDCYDALWSDHNLVSMTLYSGPATARDFYVSYSRPNYDWHGTTVGWMLTGDAHLDQVGRRKAFFDHYATVVDLTATLMLPHHGSIHNFDPALLTGFPKLQIAYAPAGPNSYGHPHPSVRRRVRYTASFRRIGTKRRSELGAHIVEW